MNGKDDKMVNSKMSSPMAEELDSPPQKRKCYALNGSFSENQNSPDEDLTSASKKSNGRDGQMKCNQNGADHQVFRVNCARYSYFGLPRCNECLAYLNPELTIFHGDSPEALSEFEALTIPKLALNTNDDWPQYRITNFSVYDKKSHLCPFDTGLVESNKRLYISGVIKPIFDEDPSSDDGVLAKKLGPINEWFVTGFDGGERVLIGIMTDFADYFLMEPSESYKPFIEKMKVKVYLAKIVIEFVASHQGASYEDLLQKVTSSVLPTCEMRPEVLSEEILLQHAQFIIDQVQGYDSGADFDEPLLLITPCLRNFIKLSGVTLGMINQRMQRELRPRKMQRRQQREYIFATVTPLVQKLFDSIFEGVMKDAGKLSNRQMCGFCQVCQQPDCGVCETCQNMIKFGGSESEGECKLKRCPNIALDKAEDDVKEEAEIDKEELQRIKHRKRPNIIKRHDVMVRWIGKPKGIRRHKIFYSEVNVNGMKICTGDCVSVIPEDPTQPFYIAIIQYLFDCHGAKQAHLQWFYRGTETVLGEASDPQELFLVEECGNTALEAVHEKVEVLYDEDLQGKKIYQEHQREDKIQQCQTENFDGRTFFFHKSYISELARFENPSARTLDWIKKSSFLRQHNQGKLDFCVCCDEEAKRIEQNYVSLGPLLCARKHSCNDYYQSVTKEGIKYVVGDCCFIDPEVFDFCLAYDEGDKMSTGEFAADIIDEETYPELYRKSEYIKGSNETCSEPFRVVCIRSIYMLKDGHRQTPLNAEEIKIRVNKLYRPEDTHLDQEVKYSAELNKLYWSSEQVVLNLSDLGQKCIVHFQGTLQSRDHGFCLGELGNFIFQKAYIPHKKTFVKPPFQSFCLFESLKPNGLAKRTQDISDMPIVHEEDKPLPLKSLDVFAGCGGLTEGLRQAGVAEVKWAIEIEEVAAEAFRLNHPNCTVFQEDCNSFLQRVQAGHPTDKEDQRLPQKGDVELLCGGPPCQGFSTLNRFNSNEYSRFKNSLIATYLSFCDFYRPRFFLLENVRNFVVFKCSMVLKLTLRSLLHMGYQCTFGVLQAGSYGVAQSRRRAFILAAASGEKLPNFPEPLHTFHPRAMQLSVVVDDNKLFTTNIRNLHSAPFRTITVRDAISDLPDIENGANYSVPYKGKAETHYQALLRDDHEILEDHICKDMCPLVAARMSHIPQTPGSDWRDLPNICVKLSNGTWTNKLLYAYQDKQNGASEIKKTRAVCRCATGQPCDPSDRQLNTLIPWFLPHTAKRHAQWAGVYGRLSWEGFFSTTITNPEPTGMQGRVLHPEQHRVVSVRECARSQGFPDSYRFLGNILDMHRQVGNAVPPPLGKAIGLEIKKSLAWKKSRKLKH